MSDRLYEITYATNRQYFRAASEGQALGWWNNSHPALTPAGARIRVFPQEELDALVEVDPKLADRLRRL